MSVANDDGKISGNAIKTLYISFIEYANAFAIVKPDIFFEILPRAGAPDKEINIIQNIYLKQKATLRHENETSEEITIKRSVRQGYIILPSYLFKMYTEYLIIEHCMMESEYTSMYTIFQTSDMQMTQSYWQRVSNSFNIMIDILDATCRQHGMEMNAKKKKINDRRENTWETM